MKNYKKKKNRSVKKSKNRFNEVIKKDNIDFQSGTSPKMLRRGFLKTSAYMAGAAAIGPAMFSIGCSSVANIQGDKRKDRNKTYPTSVIFNNETLYRTQGVGDNWCMTWAADGTKITAMCDGDWLDQKVSSHSHLYRIIGGPQDFERRSLDNFPRFDWSNKETPEKSWFTYGVVSVDGVLYVAPSKTPLAGWSGPFRGIKLLRSDDNGMSWDRVARDGKLRPIGPDDKARYLFTEKEMFFLEEFGIPHQEELAYPFSFVDFVQNGKDNSKAKDNYVYIYSPEGAQSHKLNLARVHKDLLGVRSSWKYFTRFKNGHPQWSGNIRERGAVHIFPHKSTDGNYFGWYSWLPSVVWNEGLGLYIMVNGGTYAGSGMTSSDKDYYSSWMHTKTGSLGFWFSEKPWGPWREIQYTEYWTADSPGNLTYQPKLSPKWISKSGKEKYLIWSDAMRNAKGRSHSVNYTWNQMKITIQ